MDSYLILGCGYTGKRVARALALRGEKVIATTRDPQKLVALQRSGVDVRALEVPGGSLGPLPGGLRVLHSVPPVGEHDLTPDLLRMVASAAQRIVYLSTTGVYGDARFVNEHTAVYSEAPRQQARLAAEKAVVNSGIGWCVLRPAAIYGPDRGFHISMARGTAKLTGDGLGFISRVHVEDLAAITIAALDSHLSGCWPVADDLPCTQLEMARFCSALLDVPLPPSVSAEQVPPSRRGDRRVEGSAVRKLLRVDLRYPTYREGLKDAAKTAKDVLDC